MLSQIASWEWTELLLAIERHPLININEVLAQLDNSDTLNIVPIIIIKGILRLLPLPECL